MAKYCYYIDQQGVVSDVRWVSYDYRPSGQGEHIDEADVLPSASEIESKLRHTSSYQNKSPFRYSTEYYAWQRSKRAVPVKFEPPHKRGKRAKGWRK
jgi:hypothetical protein